MTLVSDDEKMTRRFSQWIDGGRVADELMKRLENLFERTEATLGMSPDNFHVDLVLLYDADAVAAKYDQTHKEPRYQKAYYSMTEKAIYVSVADVKPNILVHEFAHAIVDASPKLSHRVHEYIAQCAEKYTEV